MTWSSSSRSIANACSPKSTCWSDESNEFYDRRAQSKRFVRSPNLFSIIRPGSEDARKDICRSFNSAIDLEWEATVIRKLFKLRTNKTVNSKCVWTALPLLWPNLLRQLFCDTATKICCRYEVLTNIRYERFMFGKSAPVHRSLSGATLTQKQNARVMDCTTNKRRNCTCRQRRRGELSDNFWLCKRRKKRKSPLFIITRPKMNMSRFCMRNVPNLCAANPVNFDLHNLSISIKQIRFAAKACLVARNVVVHFG